MTEVIRLAEKEGYVDLNQKDTLQAGDKVYLDWMGKSIVLFQIGEDPLENGMNILGAHVDSPRWISNRIRCMRKVDLHILIHTTMAESKISVGDTSIGYSRCSSEKKMEQNST